MGLQFGAHVRDNLGALRPLDERLQTVRQNGGLQARRMTQAHHPQTLLGGGGGFFGFAARRFGSRCCRRRRWLWLLHRRFHQARQDVVDGHIAGGRDEDFPLVLVHGLSDQFHDGGCFPCTRRAVDQHHRLVSWRRECKLNGFPLTVVQIGIVGLWG